MSCKFFHYFSIGLMILMLMNDVQAQESFEPDSEPVRPQSFNPPTNRRRYDRFNQWMRIINDFFTQGNWLNGGPSNLIEYITQTLAKLLDVLMHRRGPPVTAPVEPPRPSNDVDDDDTFEYKVRDSNVRRQPSFDRYRRQKSLNLNDIIRMIPMNQLNFDNNH
ncbi:hypothetical protein BLA29_001136 [Euroglyphus maynei]|uniref:Uncharacterized protein n=1 Tax=Euroglyphus maynei TaxID=6958 RepID=A0A1Y3B6U1_EURMA|nr:hypothetical protein BLA29_001136 [Euroglyphus maynei]